MKRSGFKRKIYKGFTQKKLKPIKIVRSKLPKIGKLQRTCDALMQKLGKLRSPKSIISGQPTEVMHHLVPKSVSSALRYNWDNLIPLTNAEHCRLHQSPDPTIEMMIVKAKGGTDWFFQLKQKGRVYNKVNRAYYETIKLDLELELITYE